MKKFVILIIAMAVFLLCESKTFAATDQWKFGGVVFQPWGVRLNNGSYEDNPDYASLCPQCGPMGTIGHFQWNRVNPGSGQYNWSLIDDYIQRAATMQTTAFPDGRRIAKPVVIEIDLLLFSGGNFTPAWVGVAPKTVTCGGQQINVPPYDNSYFRTAYYDFIRAIKARYDDQFSNYPNLAGFVFSNGGDGEAYPIKSDCSDAAAEQGYAEFIRGLGGAVGSFRNIPVYLPAGGASFTIDVIQAAKQYGFGVKSNSINSGLGPTGFRWTGDGDEPFEQIFGNLNKLSERRPLSASQKYDESTREYNYERISWSFEDAVIAGSRANRVYSQLLMILSFKPDWMDFRDLAAFQTLAGKFPNFLQNFVPAYLNQTRERTPGAWIAFADLHDSAVGGSELTCGRYFGVNACDSYTIGDWGFYLKKVGQRGARFVYSDGSARHDSDVFPNWTDDKVIDFGRQLNAGDYLSIKVEDGVWFRKSTPQQITAKLTILNVGSNSVDLEFQKANGTKHIETITTGSGLGELNKFVEVTKDIADVVFNASLDDGGDIIIRGKTGSPVVHLLEIKPDLSDLGGGSSDGGGGTVNVCPAGVPSKTLGNANCDGRIDIWDFMIWRSEFLRKRTTLSADFNGNGKVEINDFLRWRRNRL